MKLLRQIIYFDGFIDGEKYSANHFQGSVNIAKSAVFYYIYAFPITKSYCVYMFARGNHICVTIARFILSKRT
jgi:hypothetical protein